MRTIPGYVRCLHRDVKEAVEADEDGLDLDAHVFKYFKFFFPVCRS